MARWKSFTTHSKKKLLGTIKRGKVKIYSPKQMRYLHWQEIDHTHFKYKDGKRIATRHIY